MLGKLATVTEFLDWAKGQGEINAFLKTHRTREVGDKFLKNRSRRNGSPCPWEYVDVRSSVPIRLGQPIWPSEIAAKYHFVDKYANPVVMAQKTRQMLLAYFSEGPATYKYFNDGQEIDFAMLDEWWISRPLGRQATGPIVFNRSFTPFDSVDAITVDDMEWTLIHTG